MYFREKDLGTFSVAIYYTSMATNLVPKSSNINTILKQTNTCSCVSNSHYKNLHCIYNQQHIAPDLVPESSNIFLCETCDFKCSRKSQYQRHLSTRKHHLATSGNKNVVNSSVHICTNCNKEYLNRSGLWRHKKKCIGVPEPHDPSPQQQQQPHHANSNTDNSELVEKMFTMFTQMMTHNQDFMQNVIGKVQGINTNSHNNNTQFNINMFLNEQCKNAMNLGDFIKSLPITAQDYENTKDKGLADTLTNLMVDGLNSMELVERPIHCTDQKRKVMYVKDNDKWEKDKDHALFLQGVNDLADIHKKRVHLWQQENPEFKTREKLQAVFTSIIGNLFTDVTEQRKDMNKIFKGVTDSTFLDDNTKNTLVSTD